MNPRLKLWLVGAAGAGLAVVAAFGIAQEQYLFAALLAGFIGWLVLEWLRGPLPDAFLLGLLIVGYLVGNRGFAQLSLTRNLPLLPAEVGLLVGAPALLVRAACRRVPLFQSDWLNWSILAWMLAGTLRLPLDLRTFGLVAARDFALVYYASFFFIAQALARHEASRVWLRRALATGLVLLPVAVVASQLAPDFFLGRLTLRGIPVIFQKSDLTAAFLAAAFFYGWAERERGGSRLWLALAAACLLLSLAGTSPRAAMVGLLVLTGAWLLARRFRILALQAATIAAALAVAVPFYALTGRDITATEPYAIYERAASIVDWSGTRTYQHQRSADVSDNNRFRLVWWRSVATETVEQSPLTGLGFGYDLAERFLRDYGWLTVEDFAARSPHSILVAVFGRMGALGLALFLVLAAALVSSAARAFVVRDFFTMGLWSVVGVIGVSACFGVVLEGPMGATVFWTFAGAAHVATGELAVAAAPAAAPTLPAEPASV